MNLVNQTQSGAKLVILDTTKQLINLNLQLAKFNRSKSYSNTLSLFHKIHSSHNLKPDQYSLSSALTACANIPNLRYGKQLHAHAIFTGLKAYLHVSNTLLSLYAKSDHLGCVKMVFYEMGFPDIYSWTTLLSACTKLGHVYHACQLLDHMPYRNVAPWNAVITGCSENGLKNVGFELFRKMHFLGVRHDNYTFAGVLSMCCGQLHSFGKQVHSVIVKTGFLSRSSVINSLISMYFDGGDSVCACRVFKEGDESVRDEITHNAMINGLVSMERGEDALMMFKEMLDGYLRPTELTFVSLVSSELPDVACFQLHGQAMKLGYDTFAAVSNAMMAMYASRGQLNAVSEIFEGLEEKDAVSWNTMISAYAQNDHSRLAGLTYLNMRSTGVKPDEYTIGALLGISESLYDVESIYGFVVKNGLCLIGEVANAVVSAFSKQGDINMAYQLFSDMHSRNLISWNAIIHGFLLNGCPFQALGLFLEMQKSDNRPDVCTLTTLLSACANISALEHGKEVHGYIIRHRLFKEASLGNGLITMYAKCGCFDWSRRVFDCMQERDVVSWNAIISAFAQCGEGKKAVQYFTTMQHEFGIKPDQATFTAILSACGHAGLVCEGIHIFNSLVNDYGMEPNADHFSCVVDLLARAGFLDETEGLINSKDFKVDPVIWWSLFSACAAHGNVRLGRIIAGILLETEKDDPAVYVMLSNIHANTGQWEDAAEVRELMKRTGLTKQPGCSWFGS